MFKNHYVKSIFFSYGSVAIAAIFGFITVPLALNYFGKNLYGLFAITFDTLAYLSLFNFGIPWVAATIFARLNSYQAQISLMRKTIFLLSLISISVMIIFLTIYIYYPKWITFISRLDNHTLSIAKVFIAINIAFFTIKLPFSLFTQLLIFINQVYLSKIIDTLSTLITFICLLLVIYYRLDIIHYAIINGILSLIPAALSILMFRKAWQPEPVLPEHIIKQHSEDISYTHLTTSSFYFFLNNVASLALWNTGSILVGHYLGLASVAEYAVLSKFFSILFMSIVQLINILNPLYPKLIKENRLELLANIFQTATKVFPLIGGFLLILIFACFKDFVILWTHNSNIFAGYLSCLAFGLYCYFICSGVIPYFAITALNQSKSIYKLTLLEAIVSLTISIILVQKIGIPGVIFGSLIAYVCITFIFVPRKLEQFMPNIFKFNYKFIITHFSLAIIPLIIIINYINNLSFSYTKLLFILCAIALYCIISLALLGKNNLLKVISLIHTKS